MPSKPGSKSVAQPKKAASAKPKTKPISEPDLDLDKIRKEALGLESQLEAELLRDAVLSARMAMEALRADTHGPPYERRRGIRLRENALKVERAFNRLRALRLGLLLPIIEDE